MGNEERTERTTAPPGADVEAADEPRWSGLRATGGADPLNANEAHAEMMRAVARGECMLLSDLTTMKGHEVKWSAWRFHTGEMHVQAWLRPPGGFWSRGPSFTIEPHALAELIEVSKIATG